MKRITTMILTAAAGLILIAPSANATLLCIGAGNEFADPDCDATEAGVTDLVLVEKTNILDDSPTTGEEDPENTVGDLDVTVIGDTSVGVTWTYSGDTSIGFWVEKADGWYALYSFMGTLDPVSDTGLARDSQQWIDWCNEARDRTKTGPNNKGEYKYPINNCGARTSHVSVFEGEPMDVPAPSTLTLLGLGLVGMGAARRRKVA